MSSVCVLVPETEYPHGLLEYPDATAEELPDGLLVVSRDTHRLAEFPQGRYLSWSLEGEPEPGHEPPVEAEPEPEPDDAPAPEQEPAPSGA